MQQYFQQDLIGITSIEKHRQLLLASKLLTHRQLEVILKRLNRKKLTQVEANYLSRYIRPKLLASRFIAEIKLYELIEDPRKNAFYGLYGISKHAEVYVNGESQILKERIEPAKEIVKQFSERFKASKILLFGSFLTKQKFNDIDILVVSKEYADKDTISEDKFHLQFAEAEDSDPLLFRSISKICVSNYALSEQVYKYKPTFNDFLEFHFLIDELLSKSHSSIILNKLRHLVLLSNYINNTTILDAVALEAELNKIFGVQYTYLKEKKYSKVNSKNILSIIKPIIISALKEICRKDTQDFKALKDNIDLFSPTKDTNKFHKFLYDMYIEVLK